MMDYPPLPPLPPDPDEAPRPRARNRSLVPLSRPRPPRAMDTPSRAMRSIGDPALHLAPPADAPLLIQQESRGVTRSRGSRGGAKSALAARLQRIPAGRGLWAAGRWLALGVVVLVALVTQAQHLGNAFGASAPLGLGALSGSAALPPTPTPTPAPNPSALGANTTGQPCHDSVMFVPNISQWTVPPGCYGDIYSPNPGNYVPRPLFGYCDWWVMVLHPNQPDILRGPEYARDTVPAPGDAIYVAGGVQGASPAGHFADVVAVAPNNYWMLITEMNFTWRSGGFARVDYRYLHVGPGVTFIHP